MRRSAIGQHGHGDVAAHRVRRAGVPRRRGRRAARRLLEGAEALAAGYPDSAWPAARTMLRERGRATSTGCAAEVRRVCAATTSRGSGATSNWLTAIACLSMTCNTLGDAAAAEVLYGLLSPYAELTTSVLTGSACLGLEPLLLRAHRGDGGRRRRRPSSTRAALEAHLAQRRGGSSCPACATCSPARSWPAAATDDRTRATEHGASAGSTRRGSSVHCPRSSTCCRVRLEHAGPGRPRPATCRSRWWRRRCERDPSRPRPGDRARRHRHDHVLATSRARRADRPARRPALDGAAARAQRDRARGAAPSRRLRGEVAGRRLHARLRRARAEAIHCAIAIQRAHGATPRGRTRTSRCHVRIGLHIGEVLRGPRTTSSAAT